MFFLGLADIVSALLLLAQPFNFHVSKIIVIVFVAYLFLKAMLFLRDIGSVLDIVAVILLVLSLFYVLPPLLLFIVAGLLGFKGLLTLFA